MASPARVPDPIEAARAAKATAIARMLHSSGVTAALVVQATPDYWTLVRDQAIARGVLGKGATVPSEQTQALIVRALLELEEARATRCLNECGAEAERTPGGARRLYCAACNRSRGPALTVTDNRDDYDPREDPGVSSEPAPDLARYPWEGR